MSLAKNKKPISSRYKDALNDLTCNVTDAIEGVADFFKDFLNVDATGSSSRLLSNKDERSDSYKKKSILRLKERLKNRRKVHDISDVVVPLADMSEDAKTKEAIERAAAKYGLVGEPKESKKKKYQPPKKRSSFKNNLLTIKEEKEPETDSESIKDRKNSKTSFLGVDDEQRDQIFSQIQRVEIFEGILQEIKGEKTVKPKSYENNILVSKKSDFNIGENQVAKKTQSDEDSNSIHSDSSSLSGLTESISADSMSSSSVYTTPERVNKTTSYNISDVSSRDDASTITDKSANTTNSSVVKAPNNEGQRNQIFQDITNKKGSRPNQVKNNIPRITKKQRGAIFNSIELEQISQNVYKDLENQDALKSMLPEDKKAGESGTRKNGNSWVNYTDAKTKKSGQIFEI